MILKMMEVGSIPVNCYIVADEATKEAAVFDPGGHVPNILEILAEDHLKVKYIINTHAHFDHVGGNQELREKTGAPILIHKDEGPGLLAAGERAAMYGLTGFPSKADRFIKEGDTLDVGSIHFVIMELRGHSLTGLGYLFEDLFHVSASGDDILETIVGLHDIAQSFDLFCEPAFFETVPYLEQAVLIIKGLCQITVGPFAHGFDGTLDGTVGRQDQYRHIGIDLMEFLHEPDAVFS